MSINKSDMGVRQKRKRVGFADIPVFLKSPCSKTARSDYFKVFFVGFSDKEKEEILRGCPDEIDVKEVISTSVTHLVVKPPTKKDKAYLYAALYYAVISGAWILRSSWLTRSKNGVVPETEHEYGHKHVDLQTPVLSKFRGILKLYESHQKLRSQEGCNFFCNDVFKRVFILTSRTYEGKQRRAALRSLVMAGGGSAASDDSWRIIRERPARVSDLLSLIIIENGEDLSVHEINVGFIKQLLMKGVPILYEEILSQLLHNQVVPNLEIMMTHAIYYWCNEHTERLELTEQELEFIHKNYISSSCGRPQNAFNANSTRSNIVLMTAKTEAALSSSNRTDFGTADLRSRNLCEEGADILDEMETEIRENELRGERKTFAPALIEEEELHSFVVDDVAKDAKAVVDDCGLFDILDFDTQQDLDVSVSSEKCTWSDRMSVLSHIVPKALAKSGVECGSFPDILVQFFDAIMVEMENNVPSSFIHDFICHEVITSLRHSLHCSLLPSPSTLSRLLHDIAKPEFGHQFDAARAVYRLLTFFLYQFPACNEEGRFYWLQVLTDGPSEDPLATNRRRGSLLEWNNLLSRTAAFRKMVLETFTCGGSNWNLMEFIVSVLEVDLFNMEGCDGLDISQGNAENSEEDDNCNRSARSTADEETGLLEQLQNSSILQGVPLSCLVFYDPHERRKRGLDKTAMETCFAIVDNATSAESNLCAGMCWRLLAVCLEGLRFLLANRMKLFRGEQISVDLRIDVERLGRYLIKRGLRRDEITQFLPMSWVSETIRAMS